MLIVLVPSFTMFASAATTVYVNSVSGSNSSGDGSSSNPYQTFTKGYTQATNGDTLHLTGTFNWKTETGDGAYGYEMIKNITITGPDGDKAIIQANDDLAHSDKRIFITLRRFERNLSKPGVALRLGGCRYGRRGFDQWSSCDRDV